MTDFAQKRIESMLEYYGSRNYILNVNKISVLAQLIYPSELRVVTSESCINSQIRDCTNNESEQIMSLCKKYEKYYIPDESEQKGGGCTYGFGKRGLLIVRYNNVPNNSLYLIWAELEKKDFFPLFPRQKRHKK
jgi:hypothetical protein